MVDLPEYADALKAHSVRMHSELSFNPDLGYEEHYHFNSFSDSAEYSEMYNRVLEEHLANPPDSCPILELDYEYWYQLATNADIQGSLTHVFVRPPPKSMHPLSQH
jgi:hypothetical protein